MSKVGKTLRDLMYSSANVYAEFILGLVVSILIARALGPEEYGIYTFVVWLASLGIMTVNAGVAIGAIKFFSELTGKKQNAFIAPLHKYFSKVQITKASVLVLIVAIVAAFFPGVLLDPEHAKLLWFLVPVILFKSYHMYQIGLIKGLQEFRYLAIIALTVAPLNLGLVALVMYLNPTVSGFFAAFLATSVAYWAVSTYSRRRAVAIHTENIASPTRVSEDLRKRVILHLKAVSVLVIFAFIIFGQSELVFLKHFATASDIAFFSVGFMLMKAAVALVPGVYDTVLFSRISFALADPESSEAQSVLGGVRHMIILSTMVCVPLAIYADDVVALLYGDEYAPAALAVRVFSLVAIVSSIKHSTNAYLMSADMQVSILKIMSVAIVATLALDFLLIVKFGLWGAIAAYALVDVVTTAVISGFAFRLLRAWPNVGKLFKTIFCGAVASLCVIAFDTVLSFPLSFLLGGIVFVSVFIPLLLLLDCLEEPDYEAIRQLLSSKDNGAVFVCRLLLGKNA